jgi:hypothetical protein
VNVTLPHFVQTIHVGGFGIFAGLKAVGARQSALF